MLTRQLIPVATAVDLTQLGILIPKIANRRWLIVGSAPLPTKYASLMAGEHVMAVNGGIGSIAGNVDLWIVGSKPYDRKPNPHRWLHWAMLEQAAGRSIPFAVFLRQPKVASELDTLQRFEDVRCQVDDYSVMDKPTKRWLEGRLCGRVDDKSPCSSGILAAAIALYCEASHVRLEGLSLKPGYHYLPKSTPQIWWRDHVEADRRALHALKARFGERFTTDLV